MMFGRYKSDWIDEELVRKNAQIEGLKAQNKKLKEENSKLAKQASDAIDKVIALRKQVPDLDERVSPTKAIDKPASKKEQPKKYERKAMLFMVPGGAITKEEWNDCQNLFHKDFDSGIGNNPIEKVIATPVDYGVQYLIIYKEEVKE